MNLNDCLVIIPARKNSKRIKGKNLRSLNGKPLIVHSIEYASKFVDKNKITGYKNWPTPIRHIFQSSIHIIEDMKK